MTHTVNLAIDIIKKEMEILIAVFSILHWVNCFKQWFLNFKILRMFLDSKEIFDFEGFLDRFKKLKG